MAETRNLLRAVSLDHQSPCSSQDPEEWIRLAHADAPIWLHVTAVDHSEATALLAGRLGFHELAVEDALSPHERPSTQEFDEALFLVVPTLIEPTEPTFGEVAFFVRRHSLVTVTTEPCAVIDEWLQRTTRRESARSWQPEHLLHALVDGVVDAYFPALDAFEDEVDALADQIFAGDTTKVAELLLLKRRAIDYRRRLGPLRDVVNGLLRHDIDYLSDESRPYFADVLDHTLRLTELVELHRETLASLLDVHLSMVSNQLNQVVKKMTVISTVLMGMALVAGVYGMNFAHMPELGQPWGYPFALGLMLGVGLLILALFRRFRWI